MFVHNVTFQNNLRYRTWAEIDLSAMKANLEYAKRISGKPVICVIKGDAYGHGAVECGKYLQENGADMFAVACIEEALELRENGVTIPILILGYTPALFVKELSYYDLEQTVVDVSHADELNIAAEAAHGKNPASRTEPGQGLLLDGIQGKAGDPAVTGRFCPFSASDPASAEAKFPFRNMTVTEAYLTDGHCLLLSFMKAE